MHVLVLHNGYRQNGGEDAVVRSEIQLLRSRLIKVTEFVVTNEAEGDSWRDSVQLGVAASWSRSSYRRVKELCADVRPDIAHVHNFWMRLSPAVHYACKDAGVPTVQTLHNFRLVCLRGDFLRGGRVCEDCLGSTPWRGVANRCYRDSLLASGAVASMILSHRLAGTWRTQVDAFIALSEHSKSKFVEGGIPRQKLFVRPNFVEDTAALIAPPSASNTVLFVGRLSEEKGVELLLRAWREVRKLTRGVLRIVGEGPLRMQLERQAQDYGFTRNEVQFTGALPYTSVMSEIGNARALAIPSLCFENCPRTLLEAFCNGRPVVVPNRGSLDELVCHGQTGVKFAAGSECSLTETLLKLFAPFPAVDAWGANARREYLSRYTPAASFDKLMQIYEFASAQGREHVRAFNRPRQVEESS